MKKSDFIIKSKYQNKTDSNEPTGMSSREYRRWIDKQHRIFYNKNKELINLNLWNVLSIDERSILTYTKDINYTIENLTKKHLSTIRENKLKSII